MGLNDSTRISFGLNFATPSGAARPDAQITAVHEFMHAIGFGHEFNRPENEGPKDCSWQEPQPGETYGTTYDHDSITNGGYCHWNTKLSEQDGIGLRAAYGTFANTELSANNNLDGRLEVVYTYTGNVVYHRWQNSPNSGPWIGPHLLGAPDNAAKQVVLGKSPGRGLEAIYLGTDDVVYHNAQSGSGWSGQSPLGTSSNKGKRIVVADNQIGLLVVYIGTDNKLYTNRQSITGQWLGEQNIGGTLSAKELAIGRNADGRLEVFYTDASDVLWHIWQSTAVSSTWHGPLLLGTSTNKAKQLRVASHQDGRMEVVYIGMNNVLHHTWQTVVNGGWSGEALLATSQTTGKQLVIQKDAQNRLELVFTDMNDVLRRFRQNAPNTGWSNSSLLASAGDKAKKLTIGANQNGNLELIFVGTNNLLYHAWQTSPGSWSAVAELD